MSNGLSLTYKPIRLNLKHAWTIARGSSEYKDNIVVQVENDGITGYGEVAPNVRYGESPESTMEVLERAVPLFAKWDPWQFVDLGHAIQELDAAQTAAKAALDIALMDWVTKSLDVPMYRYLGLDKAKAPMTSFSIGIDAPEIIKQKVQEAEEYPLLKVKLGGDRDEEIISTIRSVTDKPLFVDANEGWKDKQEALEKVQWLEPQGVQIIEQPMPADMLDKSTLPIIADESVKTGRDIPLLAKAFDGINIKLMKSGGLQEALRMIGLARAMDLKVMLGCMVETSIAISAAASISPLVDYADLDGNLLITNDPYEGVEVHDGQLMLNDRPGTGAVPRG
jgi:L-alanine-DL-glutamate epimerase-like enolase superfamily enzyme